jgi:hypothetical protein
MKNSVVTIVIINDDGILHNLVQIIFNRIHDKNNQFFGSIFRIFYRCVLIQPILYWNNGEGKCNPSLSPI